MITMKASIIKTIKSLITVFKIIIIVIYKDKYNNNVNYKNIKSMDNVGDQDTDKNVNYKNIKSMDNVGDQDIDNKTNYGNNQIIHVTNKDIDNKNDGNNQIINVTNKDIDKKISNSSNKDKENKNNKNLKKDQNIKRENNETKAIIKNQGQNCEIQSRHSNTQIWVNSVLSI